MQLWIVDDGLARANAELKTILLQENNLRDERYAMSYYDNRAYQLSVSVDLFQRLKEIDAENSLNNLRMNELAALITSYETIRAELSRRLT
jgi:hypothetical protein